MSFVDKIKGIMGLDPEDYDNEDMGFVNKKAAEKTDSQKVFPVSGLTQLQVVLVKPERYEDAGEIADNLNAKHTVVLNLEATSKDVSRRLLDFLSGVAYANNGQIKKIANSTYIITPYNVDVMGDLVEGIENSDVFFK
ncbi:MAG: cell division protein SepF [Oscillospiraceae bacterium]|nr:cell division protein SepF [Oscillospiraceae bacterium]